jgi:rhodanese-related sulfurtransferase
MTDATPLEISLADYDKMRRNGAAHTLLDVREPKEFENSRLAGSVDIPMGEVPDRFAELPRDEMLVVMCRTGGRSGKIVALLRENGFDNATNLVGGINGWAVEIDTSLEPY